MHILRVLLCSIVWLTIALPLYAQDNTVDADGYVPTRYGVGLLAGPTYDPGNVGLVIVQGQMLFDYDRLFWHAAPESLRLKLEANLGLTLDGRNRSLLSVNMMALRYLDSWQFGSWTPYVEAGIGVIYTDFQVEGQGLRINFNPQAGIGAEYALPGGHSLAMGLRLHHISNANMHKDNRGVNSVLMSIGYLF